MIAFLFIMNFYLINNEYPKYLDLLNNYYINCLYYSKESQEFKINRLIENIKGYEYNLKIDKNFKINKLKEKEIEKIVIRWRFSNSAYLPNEKDDLKEGSIIPESILSSDEEFKGMIMKGVEFPKSKIEEVYQIKDPNPYKICNKYGTQDWCFTYKIKYILIKDIKRAFKLEEIKGKEIKISIMAIDDGLSGASNYKSITVYGLIKNFD